jgi:hypothetical protein
MVYKKDQRVVVGKSNHNVIAVLAIDFVHLHYTAKHCRLHSFLPEFLLAEKIKFDAAFGAISTERNITKLSFHCTGMISSIRI